VADRHTDGLALVLDLDDADALFGEQSSSLCELARPVGNARPHDEIAAVEREPARIT
jgi:hypothetical protein